MYLRGFRIAADDECLVVYGRDCEKSWDCVGDCKLVVRGWGCCGVDFGRIGLGGETHFGGHCSFGKFIRGERAFWAGKVTERMGSAKKIGYEIMLIFVVDVRSYLTCA